MAFWGTEVKPGKPVTHSSEHTSGRLRITQATLGIGQAKTKSILQCNVGKRSPVLLCVLIPNQTESLHLDLEFEEYDDVVFSVIGPRSVFLSGYYARKIHQSNLQSDTESFGVDIENSQNDGDSYRSEDDKYEDSFINDDNDLQVSPESPVSSVKGLDEITPESTKPKNKKGRGKQLKKKFQVIESESDAKSLESDEEDAAFTLSAFRTKPVVKTNMFDVGEKNAHATEKTGDEAKDDGTIPLDMNDQSERETKLPMDEEGTKDKIEEDELPKEVQSVDVNIIGNEVFTDERVLQNNSEDITVNQNFPLNNEKDQTEPVGLEKSKKKRKRSMKEEKTSEISVDKDHSVHGEDKEQTIEPSPDVEIGANSLAPPPELSFETRRRSKRIRNGQLEKTPTDVIVIPEDDKSKQDVVDDSTKEDLPADNGEHQEQPIDNNSSTKPESLANSSEPKKKSKKKKKKTQGEEDLNMSVPKKTDSQQTTSVQDQNQSAIADQKRTLPNGLIIEELASGQENGKVAAPGKTVKIYYTGMLKDSEHVFDSNVGKSAFKFRLGDEQYIDGWNAGIDGMHVGDKRRLIIPPQMGFGNHAVAEVPPNSWLVYDVELVSVRR